MGIVAAGRKPYFQTTTWGTIHAMQNEYRPHCGLWLPRLRVVRWLDEDEMDADDLWRMVCSNCLRVFDRNA